MFRAYRYQLDPNITQKRWFARSMGSARYIYNWSLAERVKAYETEKQRLRRSKKRQVENTTLP